jgi:peptidoglycan/xylan/chitin deacetylase (PgdA/CDA1 family)
MKYIHGIFVPLIFLLSACSASPSISPTAPPTDSPSQQPLVFKNTTVSLTFDDGDADNYSVREVLAQNGIHATFYIVSGFTGTDGYMTEGQLRGLYADGNEIGGHSLNHKRLNELDGADLRREICQDRLNLLAFGFNVASFAYPFGHFDDEAKQVAKDCGYNSARIVAEGPETIPPRDPFKLEAMPYIVQDTHLSKMIRYATGVEKNGGGWVIFIFHHVCDGCDEFSVSPQVFSEFASWLHEQESGGLAVKTIAEVIGGDVQPGVRP